MNNKPITQEWEKFTHQDHNVWNILFNRQIKVLENRACSEIIEGINKLSISADKIPKFDDLNITLKKATNFTVIPVDGLVAEELFFRMLSNRQFPSTNFIRTINQLDYLEEPDIFHDVFGHIPLLFNPVFADFVQAFGQKAIEAIDYNMIDLALTLYWFTVEFGLINTSNGHKIYGAGIISSKTECMHALFRAPQHHKFDLVKILKTSYRIDCLQNEYFVIDNFKQLFKAIDDLQWSNTTRSNQA